MIEGCEASRFSTASHYNSPGDPKSVTGVTGITALLTKILQRLALHHAARECSNGDLEVQACKKC